MQKELKGVSTNKQDLNSPSLLHHYILMKGAYYMRKMTYLAVLEPTNTGYSVYYPDLPGCISVGETIQEASENAKEALELHIYGMEKDNETIPIASKKLDPKDIENCLVVPITIYPDLVKHDLDNRKVKTNCTLPAWLKKMAEEKKVNYSQLLEASIMDYLGIRKNKT